MAWIESHTVLPRHRKVLLLAHDLNTDIVQTIGHLHCLWYTVLEQQENGDLSDWPDTLISQAALWKGDATEFVTRLREREWLDGHLVHDWIDYVGPYLTKKYSSGNVPRLKEIWLLHGFKYGKGQGKYAKQKASVKRVESERKLRIPFLSLPNPSSPLPSLPDLTKPNHTEACANVSRNYRDEAKEVLKFLNEKTSKKFREVDVTLDLIAARLKSGVDVQTCKTLIARKVRDWTPKPEMAGYLRPETLFNKTKFETYLAEVTT